MGQYKHVLRRVGLASGLLLFVLGIVGAVRAQNVTQGYQSDEPLQKGIIVQLKKSSAGKVEALSQADDAKMLGVVVSASDAPVSLSSNADERQVYVANYGQFDVLVSDQNGAIDVGDYIAISAVNGVGMKAQTAQTLVLGKALQAFDGRAKVESSAKLSDNLGGKRTVSIGRIRVEINVSRNPLFEREAPPGVPQFLSKAAQIVTDQPVGAVRIYASLAFLVLSIIIAGWILYAGIHSGMTAIGRNPLAKRSIGRSLFTVAIAAVIVLMLGLLAVYLLLRL